MSLVDVKVKISESLLREAELKDLLKPVELERLLRNELRRRRVESFFDAADKLAAQEQSPLTREEIEAEIARARKSRPA